MGKIKKTFRIVGILLILIGFLYLFFNFMPSFGISSNYLLLWGGIFLVIGTILTLNGKRLMSGVFIKGWKNNWKITLVLYILTFALLYLWFNSMFEILAQDINSLKTILFKISSVGLSLFLALGLINAKKIFGLKSTRY